MMRERASAKAERKGNIKAKSLASEFDENRDLMHSEESDAPTEEASKKRPSKQRPSIKKRPAAASSARVLKKPAAAPVPKVQLEQTRNQYVAWTGLRGAGQYKAFRFDNAKRQKKAKTDAYAWLGLASE